MLPKRDEGESVHEYGLRLLRFIEPLTNTRTETSPSNGGCWYCWSVDPRPDFFSMEFDAWLHTECLQRWLEGHPRCQEALIMRSEAVAG